MNTNFVKTHRLENLLLIWLITHYPQTNQNTSLEVFDEGYILDHAHYTAYSRYAGTYSLAATQR